MIFTISLFLVVVFIILVEGFKESVGAFFLSLFRIEKFFLGGVADEVQLYKHGRHRGRPQYPKSGLFHSFVDAPCIRHEKILGVFCEIYTLSLVLALRKLKHYVGF